MKSESEAQPTPTRLLKEAVLLIPRHLTTVLGLAGLLLPLEVFYAANGLEFSRAGGEPPLAIGGVFLTYFGALLVLPGLMAHSVDHALSLSYPELRSATDRRLFLAPAYGLFVLGAALGFAVLAMATSLGVFTPGAFGGIRNPLYMMNLRGLPFALVTTYPIAAFWWLTQAALIVDRQGLRRASTSIADSRGIMISWCPVSE